MVIVCWRWALESGELERNIFSATFQRRKPILGCGSCRPCVNICILCTSRKRKLIELLSYASNCPKTV